MAAVGVVVTRGVVGMGVVLARRGVAFVRGGVTGVRLLAYVARVVARGDERVVMRGDVRVAIAQRVGVQTRLLICRYVQVSTCWSLGICCCALLRPAPSYSQHIHEKNQVTVAHLEPVSTYATQDHKAAA
jgi:hypothetical protein